jgi:dipeptidyl aminopeptidase/acylaminoacyl peptidase
MGRILLVLYVSLISSIAIAGANLHHDFLDSSPRSKKIEYFWAQPDGAGPFPLLMLIHPDQDSPKIGGKAFVENGQVDFWTKKGFLTIAVSQPGYGGSDGPADFCGPESQHAVMDMLRYFIAKTNLVSKRVYLYGGSRGAVVASMVATQFPELRGIVLKSGVYDLVEWFEMRRWYDPIKLEMFWEIGWPTQDKLKERSAVYNADKIKSPILIIHGTKDTRAPLSIAEQLGEAVIKAGGVVEFKKFESEHVIPMSEIDELMDNFFLTH